MNSNIAPLRAALAEHGVTDVPTHTRWPEQVHRYGVRCRSQRTRREIADALPTERREALLYKAAAYGLDLDARDEVEVIIPSWHKAGWAAARGFDHYLGQVVSKIPVGYDVIGRSR